MNRQQRRQSLRGKIVNVPLKEIALPHQMTPDACRTMVGMRVKDNVEATGHPFHHLTANGAIVDADPTLEYLLNRLPAHEQRQKRDAALQMVKAQPLPAIPVRRDYYGIDPYLANKD